MPLDLTETLQIIKNRQWTLSDIDWDAPGAELVTDDMKPDLKAFMTDLMWIEHVGSRGFAALSRCAPTDELKEIYKYFQAEELRHANAELALMRRWGLLDEDEIPLPSKSIWFGLDFLERSSDSSGFLFLSSFIPLLETALDGALLKFLTDSVEDPLLEVVLAKINSDESRHLSVGYHVMGLSSSGGARSFALNAAKFLISLRLISPLHIIAIAPLLRETGDKLFAMGLDPARLDTALEHYSAVGERDPGVQRNGMFQAAKAFAALNLSDSPVVAAGFSSLSKVTSILPDFTVPSRPSWSYGLTFEKTA